MGPGREGGAARSREGFFQKGPRKCPTGGAWGSCFCVVFFGGEEAFAGFEGWGGGGGEAFGGLEGKPGKSPCSRYLEPEPWPEMVGLTYQKL